MFTLNGDVYFSMRNIVCFLNTAKIVSRGLGVETHFS